MEQATESQIQYIKDLLEKKRSMWTVDNAGIYEVARRTIYSQIRKDAKAAHPNNRQARREMSTKRRATAEADTITYINEKQAHYSNIELPTTKRAASTLIDELKNSW